MTHARPPTAGPRASESSSSSTERWFAETYQELRRLAEGIFSAERPERTLQPTALVHEAYLRLRDHQNPWQSRTHFLAMAARVMRRVLVDAARKRNYQKRGGGAVRVTLADGLRVDLPRPPQILDFEAALGELGRYDQRKAWLVELRAFGGLTVPECAEELGISTATVNREWRAARLWLRRMLAEQEADAEVSS